MTTIDIKTGKAEPWAALQTAAQSLLNEFDGVIFEPGSHVYTYKGQHWPSITQILKTEGFIDTTWFDEWSRDKGSMVHLAVKYDIAGELNEESLDDEIRPYLTGFRNPRSEHNTPLFWNAGLDGMLPETGAVPPFRARTE